MKPIIQQMTQGIRATTLNSGTYVHLQYVEKLMSMVK